MSRSWQGYGDGPDSEEALDKQLRARVSRPRGVGDPAEIVAYLLIQRFEKVFVVVFSSIPIDRDYGTLSVTVLKANVKKELQYVINEVRVTA